MIRLIYKQIWNRKWSNGWLLAELFLVFFLLWYMVDFFFSLGYSFSQKNYRDLEHAWEIKIAELPQDHPSYDLLENEPEARYQNFKRVLDLLKQYPLIESVGISYSGASPGKPSMSGSSFISPVDSSKMVFGQWVFIDPEYDFMSVFRISKNKGKTVVPTSDFNWTIPNGIVINKLMEDLLMNGQSVVGTSLNSPGREGEHFTVIGVVDNTKRFDSALPWGMVYLSRKLDAGNLLSAEIVVRSKSGISNERFKAAFTEEMVPILRVGNFYFHTILYFPKIQSDTEYIFGLNTLVQTQAYLMAFFMLNLILCLIGTFWYRVYVRREEIGIRIALGASRKDILKLFCQEVVCLLTLILLPVMLLEYQIVHLDLLITYGDGEEGISHIIYKPFLRYLVTNAITFVLMVGICLAAVWLPARKAAVLQAAEALHDE